MQNLNDLASFYEQKYHLQVALARNANALVNWDKDGLLIGMPDEARKRQHLNGSELLYDREFGITLESRLLYEDGMPIARLGDNFFILLFNPQNREAIDLANKLLDQHVPSLARKQRLQQLGEFTNSLQGITEDIIETKKEEIDHNEWEIANQTREMRELARKTAVDRQLLHILETSPQRLKQRLIRIYVELKRLVPGMYESFRCEGTSVIGKTYVILINHEDYDYEFGPFTVEVDLKKSDVAIRSDMNVVDGHCHPHIHGSSICWGNIGSTVPRLLGGLELHGLFELIHTFLCTYNEDDPYQRIEHWDPNWEDPDNEAEEYCSWCDEYGHDIDDCYACYWCEACQCRHAHDEECPLEQEDAHEAAA